MSKLLTERDLPILRAAGATVSLGGSTWFIRDRDDHGWRVSINEDNQQLEFAGQADNNPYVYSKAEPMSREEFAAAFERTTNRPRVDTGD